MASARSSSRKPWTRVELRLLQSYIERNREIEGQTPAEDSWRRTTRIWKTTTEWLRALAHCRPDFRPLANRHPPERAERTMRLLTCYRPAKGLLRGLIFALLGMAF